MIKHPKLHVINRKKYPPLPSPNPSTSFLPRKSNFSQLQRAIYFSPPPLQPESTLDSRLELAPKFDWLEACVAKRLRDTPRRPTSVNFLLENSRESTMRAENTMLTGIYILNGVLCPPVVYLSRSNLSVFQNRI